MLSLDDAKILLAWMRYEGLSSASIGDISLTLAEGPPPYVAFDDDIADQRRRAPRPTTPEDDPMTFDGEHVPSFKEGK